MEFEVIVDINGKCIREQYDSRGGAEHAYRMWLLHEPFTAELVVRYDSGRTKTLEAFGDC